MGWTMMQTKYLHKVVSWSDSSLCSWSSTAWSLGLEPSESCQLLCSAFKSFFSLQTAFYVLKRSFLKQRLLLWASLWLWASETGTPGKLWVLVWGEGNRAVWVCFTLYRCLTAPMWWEKHHSSGLSPLWHHCEGLKLPQTAWCVLID